jgi:hypothetical protein
VFEAFCPYKKSAGPQSLYLNKMQNEGFISLEIQKNILDKVIEISNDIMPQL